VPLNGPVAPMAVQTGDGSDRLKVWAEPGPRALADRVEALDTDYRPGLLRPLTRRLVTEPVSAALVVALGAVFGIEVAPL
jgi:hypothetical protein